MSSSTLELVSRAYRVRVGLPSNQPSTGSNDNQDLGGGGGIACDKL